MRRNGYAAGDGRIGFNARHSAIGYDNRKKRGDNE
jgi:hypothetical protein